MLQLPLGAAFSILNLDVHYFLTMLFHPCVILRWLDSPKILLCMHFIPFPFSFCLYLFVGGWWVSLC